MQASHLCPRCGKAKHPAAKRCRACHVETMFSRRCRCDVEDLIESYFAGANLRDMAERAGLSRERVRQILARADRRAGGTISFMLGVFVGRLGLNKL